MRPGPKPRMFGACCDRCGSVYLVRQFPALSLCPDCYLGGMPAAERGRLLGHIELTGQRIDADLRRAS